MTAPLRWNERPRLIVPHGARGHQKNDCVAAAATLRFYQVKRSFLLCVVLRGKSLVSGRYHRKGRNKAGTGGRTMRLLKGLFVTSTLLAVMFAVVLSDSEAQMKMCPANTKFITMTKQTQT